MITPVKVDKGVYRGPSPVTDEDWTLLQNLGIKFTLDLQSGASLMKDGSPLEETLQGDKYGIRVYSHPLGEFIPPTEAELEAAFWVLVSNKKPIYVHCKAGVDRTGMVIAHWRIKYYKWTRAAAIKEMKAMGTHWWYFFWIWSL